MNDNNMHSTGNVKEEEHVLVEAIKQYLHAEKHDSDKERAMLDVARDVLGCGRRLKRPKDIDVDMWQEANATLLEAAQHKILSNGDAVVLGFMPVTVGVKNGSLSNCGGHFNAENVNQMLYDIIPDMGITVADGWFHEDQVKEAQASDLHVLLSLVSDQKPLAGYWEPRALSMDEGAHYARVFLAVALTVSGPLPANWSFEWPFTAISLPNPDKYQKLEKALWRAVDKPSNRDSDVFVQVMEPMLHEDALSESQTQMDLLRIERALQDLNARVDSGEKIEADLRLQVIWPQAPGEAQMAQAQPSLRLRVMHKTAGKPEAKQDWFTVSYNTKNTNQWHDLLVEVMQMVYAQGHGFLQVQQMSGLDFQRELMLNAMTTPTVFQ